MARTGDCAYTHGVNNNQQRGLQSAPFLQARQTPDRGDITYSEQRKTETMKLSTQDKVEGVAKGISGNVKVFAGKAIKSDRLQNEGRQEKAIGKIQKKIGEIETVLGN